MAFGVFHMSSVGKLPHAAVGLVLAIAFFAVMWGLRRRSAPARVGAIMLSVLSLLMGLLMLLPGGWAGLVPIALGVVLLALLLVPSGARRYFDHRGAQVGVS